MNTEATTVKHVASRAIPTTLEVAEVVVLEGDAWQFQVACANIMEALLQIETVLQTDFNHQPRVKLTFVGDKALMEAWVIEEGQP